jgi:hypothetical protein
VNSDNDPAIEKLIKSNNHELVELRGTIMDLRRTVDHLVDCVNDLQRHLARR